MKEGIFQKQDYVLTVDRPSTFIAGRAVDMLVNALIFSLLPTLLMILLSPLLLYLFYTDIKNIHLALRKNLEDFDDFRSL